MALFNYAAKEITLKIVYYGPGLSGKTTNLQQLHSALDPEKTGRLISLATETDRTLFFDFLPVEIGKIKDFSVRFQLYTVPGQIKYNLTRKAVLKGADAVVFVADSQREVREADVESFANMKENLLSNNINPDNIVLILQYNKRDLSNILSVDELNKILNSSGYIYLEAEAINGKGVKETFQTVTKLLIKDLSEKYKFDIQPPTQPEETFTAVSDETFMSQIDTKSNENVIPAKAGIQRDKELDSRLHGNDELEVFSEQITEQPIPSEETAGHSLSPEPSEAAAAEEPAQFYQLQQEQVFTKKYKEESEMPKTGEPLRYSSEHLDRMTENLRENTRILAGIKSAINELLDELKKSREEQKEVLAILRGIKINETIERMKEKEKEKKGWLTK
ncbi:MAG: GTPase domain-containing protein [Thermodesulfovibrionales bacterium]|nr:GTPase domain-containing protein [Thermodesulfovibrionales bacterium]